MSLDTVHSPVGGTIFCAFNAAGEFVDIEKMLRPVEAVKAPSNPMGSLIGPQVKAMREAQQARHA